VVHCLVRGADREAAAARLRRVMDGYGLGGADLERRVRVVPGDLALPGLGLADADFDRLAHGVDVVFHAGAAVNLVSSYAQLKAATVGGTAEILRLAARHRSVPVHHVSTVGVFAGDGAGPIGPADPTGPSEALQLGYPQSKWVAEGLVDIARSRSLPVTVYRPTRITGHSRTGAGQRGDYLWLLIKGCLQAGAAPAGVSSAFDLVPVDYVSEAIVALSQRPAAAGRTFHLAAGRLTRLDTMLGWLRERGYRLPCIDAGAWLDRIGADPGNAAFPLLGVLASELTGAGSEGGQIFEPSSEVRRAQVGKAMFGSYVDHFVRTGWLPAPR
jgi:thioester reductase-like protein